MSVTKNAFAKLEQGRFGQEGNANVIAGADFIKRADERARQERGEEKREEKKPDTLGILHQQENGNQPTDDIELSSDSEIDIPRGLNFSDHMAIVHDRVGPQESPEEENSVEQTRSLVDIVGGGDREATLLKIADMVNHSRGMFLASQILDMSGIERKRVERGASRSSRLSPESRALLVEANAFLEELAARGTIAKKDAGVFSAKKIQNPSPSEVASETPDQEVRYQAEVIESSPSFPHSSSQLPPAFSDEYLKTIPPPFSEQEKQRMANPPPPFPQNPPALPKEYLDQFNPPPFPQEPPPLPVQPERRTVIEDLGESESKTQWTVPTAVHDYITSLIDDPANAKRLAKLRVLNFDIGGELSPEIVTKKLMQAVAFGTINEKERNELYATLYEGNPSIYYPGKNLLKDESRQWPPEMPENPYLQPTLAKREADWNNLQKEMDRGVPPPLPVAETPPPFPHTPPPFSDEYLKTIPPPFSEQEKQRMANPPPPFPQNPPALPKEYLDQFNPPPFPQEPPPLPEMPPPFPNTPPAFSDEYLKTIPPAFTPEDLEKIQLSETKAMTPPPLPVPETPPSLPKEYVDQFSSSQLPPPFPQEPPPLPRVEDEAGWKILEEQMHRNVQGLKSLGVLGDQDARFQTEILDKADMQLKEEREEQRRNTPPPLPPDQSSIPTEEIPHTVIEDLGDADVVYKKKDSVKEILPPPLPQPKNESGWKELEAQMDRNAEEIKRDQEKLFKTEIEDKIDARLEEERTESAPPSLPERLVSEEELRDTLSISRRIYAEQTVIFKNELREKKKWYGKLAADLGFPGRQMPQTDKSPEFLQAEKDYFESKKRLYVKMQENGPLASHTARALDIRITSQVEQEWDVLQRKINESLPPLEKGIITKGFEKWTKLPMFPRAVISSVLVAGGGWAFGSFGLAGAVVAGGYRLGRSVAGAGAALGAGKYVDSITNKKAKKRKAETLSQYAGSFNPDTFVEKERELMEFFEKEENQKKRDRLKKGAAMVVAGGLVNLGTSVSMKLYTEAAVPSGGGNVQEATTAGKGSSLPEADTGVRGSGAPRSVDGITAPKPPVAPAVSEAMPIAKPPVQEVPSVPKPPVVAEVPANVGPKIVPHTEAPASVRAPVSVQPEVAPAGAPKVETIASDQPQELTLQESDSGMVSEIPPDAEIPHEITLPESDSGMISAESHAPTLPTETVSVDQDAADALQDTGGLNVEHSVEPNLMQSDAGVIGTPTNESVLSPLEHPRAPLIADIPHPGEPLLGGVQGEIPRNFTDSVKYDVGGGKTVDLLESQNHTPESVYFEGREIVAQPPEPISTSDIVLGKFPLKTEFQFDPQFKNIRTAYNIMFEKMATDWDKSVVDYRLPIEYQGGRIMVLQKGNALTVLLNGQRIADGAVPDNGLVGLRYNESLGKGTLMKNGFQQAYDKAFEEINKNMSKFQAVIKK